MYKRQVSYTGLVPGKEYKVTGVLMDKKTGEKLIVNGKETVSYTHLDVYKRQDPRL